MSEASYMGKMTAPCSGSAYGSVIVEPPAHPEGSNENNLVRRERNSIDGAALLASIQAAGRSWQEFQAQSRAQAVRLRELVAEVREHIRAVEARAKEAEARERETRLWADATVAAAEARAQAAEECARDAEKWLAQISEAVHAAFPACIEPEPIGEQEAA